MTTFETIVVERPEPRIARIVMNRPEARNAQNLQMTYDLNAAFDQAVQDDAVKVIILAGNGPHFSSGHDLRPGGKNAAGTDEDYILSESFELGDKRRQRVIAARAERDAATFDRAGSRADLVFAVQSAYFGRRADPGSDGAGQRAEVRAGSRPSIYRGR